MGRPARDRALDDDDRGQQREHPRAGPTRWHRAAPRRPRSPTRGVPTAFTDAWNNSGCDRTQLRPGGNDIDATVTNLFVAHNRMHDFSCYLGFTGDNYNLRS